MRASVVILRTLVPSRRFLKKSISLFGFKQYSKMIVQVEEGKLQGVEKTSTLTGRTFHAFLGIPYAKPPVGDLRFKAPVPIGKWDGVRNASEEGGICSQMDFESQKIIGGEDCLYLNIYTPEAPANIKTRKSVMVCIHGGGFIIGSASAETYGPNFIIDRDVIFVTFNYRLHVFGFLNTGTPNCPGNAGLKDQLLAMKWIKRNIANFGGDPENITLFGVSAGATSVHLHMLSPQSKGLFHRAIIQSGDALVPWAIEENPEIVAREIGQLAGYEGGDMGSLVEHLKKEPAEKLTQLVLKCYTDAIQREPGRCIPLTFIPSIEKIKDDAFLFNSSNVLMKQATHIPTIAGYTENEGLIFYFGRTQEHVNLLLDNLPIVVKNNFQLDDSEQADLLEKIKTFYFQNKPITHGSVQQFMDLFTDMYFMRFHEALDYLSQSPVPPYIYLFAHDGKLNLFKNMVKRTVDLDIKGAAHADDLGYLLNDNLRPEDIDDSDKKVIDNVCTLWTDFAKTGNPTSSLPNVNWKPHTTRNPSYLRIEESLRVFNEKLFEERLAFWKNWSSHFKR